MPFKLATEPVCNICGGSSFTIGASKRLARTKPPKCGKCGSLERQRSLRQLYETIGQEYFRKASCIQFSGDSAAPGEWFESQLISNYGGQNSQDVRSIQFPDETFDWVICNHVLEHIDDHLTALKELVRVCTTDGAIQVSFPMPHFKALTEDWGFAKPECNGHYRTYGADVVDEFLRKSGAAACLAVVVGDSVTGEWNNSYILGKSQARITQLCEKVIKKHPVFLYHF